MDVVGSKYIPLEVHPCQMMPQGLLHDGQGRCVPQGFPTQAQRSHTFMTLALPTELHSSDAALPPYPAAVSPARHPYPCQPSPPPQGQLYLAETACHAEVGKPPQE